MFADPAIVACVVDPADANVRSLRMFEKVRFEPAGRYLDDDGTPRRILRRGRTP